MFCFINSQSGGPTLKSCGVCVLSLAAKLLFLWLFVWDNEKTYHHRGRTLSVDLLFGKKHGLKANIACCWAMHMIHASPTWNVEGQDWWWRIYSLLLCSFDCQVLFPTNKYTLPCCWVRVPQWSYLDDGKRQHSLPFCNFVYHSVTSLKSEPCFGNSLRFNEALLGPSLHWINCLYFHFCESAITCCLTLSDTLQELCVSLFCFLYSTWLMLC